MAYAVVTRDAEGAEPYARALAPLGLAVIAMPVTRTAPPDDPGALARAVGEVERGAYDAIFVASARGARALLDAGFAGIAGAARVWAVGPATARVLAAAGVSAAIPEPRPAAGGRAAPVGPAPAPPAVLDGAAAARAMLGELRAGARVLVPRAAEGRDEAIELLRAGGVRVDPVVAYRTVAIAGDDPVLARGREVLAAGQAAVCGVFAPSQVAALDAILELPAIATRWVAIGETTAAALRAAGARDVAVAASPTPEGIANAARAVYPAGT